VGELYDERLLYTACNEDTESELRALAIREGDRVLAVTGSGGRVLSLLPARPGAIVAVDFNPAQGHLLELKMAAFRRLAYDDVLAFLGVERLAGREREALYRERLRPDLAPAAAAFFDREVAKIRRGILFEGAQERYFRTVARLLLLLRRRRLGALFAAPTVEEQRRIYDERFDTPLWRASVRLLCNRFFFRVLLRDPSYFRHADVPGGVGGYLLERVAHSFRSHLFRENHFLALLAFGRYPGPACYPRYLRRASYDAVRDGLERVRVRAARIEGFLAEEAAPGSFDAFSLSDVSGWTDAAGFEALLGGIRRAARPGARYCWRNFLAKRRLPPSLEALFESDEALARELDERDASFGYTFEVGRVRAAERQAAGAG
jgi:S-adenosylmethionine-diacylglycerol 3-amino-3-carboxypropyl transferase